MSKSTWFQNTRLQAVETLSNWSGRVNTTDIIKIFSVSRSIAQSDIHTYLKMAPGNLSYHRQKKAYISSSRFKPIFDKGGQLSDYLALEIGENPIFNVGDIKIITPPQLEVNPLIIRPILNALKQRLGIETVYRSLNSPQGETRIIFPHYLVNTGFRWHVRAYCNKKYEFRDFNLSRMVSALDSQIIVPREADSQNDVLWHKQASIVLKPNNKLSIQEQNLIADEFKMTNKRLTLSVPISLLSYYLQIYQVSTNYTSSVARESRLVIANRKTIEKYFW